ncbi:MAG TPA: hypothetical protein VIY47_05540 [Ignavibacteriaceae bacterium]
MNFPEGTRLFVFRTEESASFALAQWRALPDMSKNMGPCIFLAWDVDSATFDFSDSSLDFGFPKWNLDFSRVIPGLYIPTQDNIFEKEGGFHSEISKGMTHLFSNIPYKGVQPFAGVSLENQHKILRDLLSLPIVDIGEYHESLSILMQMGKAIGANISDQSMSCYLTSIRNGVDVIQSMVDSAAPYSGVNRSSSLRNEEWRHRLDWNVKKVILESPDLDCWDALGCNAKELNLQTLLILDYIRNGSDFVSSDLNVLPYSQVGLSCNGVWLYDLKQWGFIQRKGPSFSLTSIGDVVVNCLLENISFDSLKDVCQSGFETSDAHAAVVEEIKNTISNIRNNHQKRNCPLQSFGGNELDLDSSFT